MFPLFAVFRTQKHDNSPHEKPVFRDAQRAIFDFSHILKAFPLFKTCQPGMLHKVFVHISGISALNFGRVEHARKNTCF